MFCLLAVKETSCVGHCNVVTLCVVISGCFNFKSIKKSGGWDRKCNMDHIMVIHGVGPRSSTNITLGAYCIPTKMKDQDSTWEFYYTKSMWAVPADWIFAKRTDRLWAAAAKEEEDYLISVASQSDTIASFVLVNKVQVYCDEFSL